jgi:hypothetical protein
MPVEESGLAFADLGVAKPGAKRLYRAPNFGSDPSNDDALGASDRGRSEFLERETGLAGELRSLALGGRRPPANPRPSAW